MKSEVADVRQRAAHILGLIDSPSKPAVPDLTTLTRTDPDVNVRQSAGEALKRVSRD